MQNGNLPHLSKFDQRLLGFLAGHKQFRRSTKQLRPDGSFYLSNKEIQKEMKVSRRGLIYSKKRLQNTGMIKFRTHQGRGMATDYWILLEPERKETITTISMLSQAPLNPEEVKRFYREHGKETAKRFFERAGYNPADIEALFED